MSDDSESSGVPETKIQKLAILIYESIKRRITLNKDRKDPEM